MIKFTEEQISNLPSSGKIRDDNGEILFIVVDQKIESFDKGKSAADVVYIIKELSTGKFYKATLMDSEWHGQDEYNANQSWTEVYPYEETVTSYSRTKPVSEKMNPYHPYDNAEDYRMSKMHDM